MRDIEDYEENEDGELDDFATNLKYQKYTTRLYMVLLLGKLFTYNIPIAAQTNQPESESD